MNNIQKAFKAKREHSERAAGLRAQNNFADGFVTDPRQKQWSGSANSDTAIKQSLHNDAVSPLKVGGGFADPVATTPQQYNDTHAVGPQQASKLGFSAEEMSGYNAHAAGTKGLGQNTFGDGVANTRAVGYIAPAAAVTGAAPVQTAATTTPAATTAPVTQVAPAPLAKPPVASVRAQQPTANVFTNIARAGWSALTGNDLNYSNKPANMLGGAVDASNAVASVMQPNDTSWLRMPKKQNSFEGENLLAQNLAGGFVDAHRGLRALAPENNPSLEQGAAFLEGPGTGKSDSIPANLSRGEAVLPAETVRKVGAENIHSLIKETTGKAPQVGLRSGGNYKDAVIDRVDLTLGKNPTVASAAEWQRFQNATAPRAVPEVKIPNVSALTEADFAELARQTQRAPDIQMSNSTGLRTIPSEGVKTDFISGADSSNKARFNKAPNFTTENFTKPQPVTVYKAPFDGKTIEGSAKVVPSTGLQVVEGQPLRAQTLTGADLSKTVKVPTGASGVDTSKPAQSLLKRLNPDVTWKGTKDLAGKAVKLAKEKSPSGGVIGNGLAGAHLVGTALHAGMNQKDANDRYSRRFDGMLDPNADDGGVEAAAKVAARTGLGYAGDVAAMLPDFMLPQSLIDTQPGSVRPTPAATATPSAASGTGEGAAKKGLKQDIGYDLGMGVNPNGSTMQSSKFTKTVDPKTGAVSYSGVGQEQTPEQIEADAIRLKQGNQERARLGLAPMNADGTHEVNDFEKSLRMGSDPEMSRGLSAARDKAAAAGDFSAIKRFYMTDAERAADDEKNSEYARTHPNHYRAQQIEREKMALEAGKNTATQSNADRTHALALAKEEREAANQNNDNYIKALQEKRAAGDQKVKFADSMFPEEVMGPDGKKMIKNPAKAEYWSLVTKSVKNPLELTADDHKELKRTYDNKKMLDTVLRDSGLFSKYSWGNKGVESDNLADYDFNNWKQDGDYITSPPDATGKSRYKILASDLKKGLEGYTTSQYTDQIGGKQQTK